MRNETHNSLPKLEAGYCRGQAYIHWAVTILDRKAGWLMSLMQFGRHVSWVVFLCANLSTSFAQEVPQGRLLFLGIAYDETVGPGATANAFNYAPDNFTRLFLDQSKPLFREIKYSTLKGAAATKPAVAAQLYALQRNAKKDDLVFIYWGTHGATNKKGWGANLPGNTIVYGTEIKQVLASIPCPVIVLISTCGSGGFLRTRPTEFDLPSNVAAAAACGRRRSASNELDIAMLEALAGFADRDADGLVTLGEALRYLPQRYAEFFAGESGEDIHPILFRPATVSGKLALAKIEGNHAAAVLDGQWYGVSILERQEGKSKVRFLGYDSTSRRGGYAMHDRFLDDEYLDFAGDMPPAEVESEGQWYPAKIVQRRQSTYKVHYIGSPESDDEVVPPERIRFPFAGTPPEPTRKRKK